MTGEVTLRGKVLPIGGLKEKTLAAYRVGIRKIIIPKDNEKDLQEIPQEVLKKHQCGFVRQHKHGIQKFSCLIFYAGKQMEIKKSAFVSSAASPGNRIKSHLKQIAVVGKSNVGKSSFINL